MMKVAAKKTIAAAGPAARADAEGTPGVFIVRDGRVVFQPVKVGARGRTIL